MSEDALVFSVLGPLRARRRGAELALGSPQQMALLAALVLREGAQADLGELVQGLWGEQPPPAAEATVRTYVSRLRRVLGAAGDTPVLLASGHGYVVPRATFTLDLTEFRRLAGEAATAAGRGDGERAAEQLRSALGLWRGAPLAGLPGPWAASQRDRLGQLRAAATEDLLAAELAVGRYTEVLAELAVLVAEHPLRERLRELQVQALWRSGRQAEALAAYAAARATLADELGIEPGRELSDLQRRILAGEDPALPPAESQDAPVSRPHVPAQLPPDSRGFTARTAALDWLTDAVAGAGATGAPLVAAIRGMGGVGKTTLAVHWAHAVAAQFPDGQLYVNLRGFDPARAPMPAGEAVRGFLDALGVAPADVPGDLDRETALFRSLVAGRRLLVLLDNARDAEQVRPLLPASRGSVTVVTSRNPLAGLVTTEGALSLPLEVFPPEPARQYLAARLGEDRLAADPAAVDVLVQRCAGLPLALAIVAARAVLNPSFPLAALATELGRPAGGLDGFAALDDASDVRAVFSWSYRTLHPATARLFGCLALIPGSDTGRSAAASAAAVPAPDARRQLAELVAAHLVTEHRPGRYLLHDLVRAYAGELTPDPEERRAVLRRVLDHRLHTVASARALAAPNRPPLDLGPPAAGVVPETFERLDTALAWFDTEAEALVATVEEGHRHGFDRRVCELATALMPLQFLRGTWHRAIDCQRLALASAQRMGDELRTGTAHQALGIAFSHLDRFDDSELHLRAALGAFGSVGELRRQAHTHLNLATMLDGYDGYDVPVERRRAQEAADHLRAGLALYERIGDLEGEAGARNNLGFALLTEGTDLVGAVDELERSVGLYRRVEDDFGVAMAGANLARAHQARGEHADAVAAYRRALPVFQELADVVNEADTAISLGTALWQAGDPGAARLTWAAARDVLAQADLGREQPGARRLEAQLDALIADPALAARHDGTVLRD